MRLSEQDKKYLMHIGYQEKGFGQIEEAIKKTVYTSNGKKISAKRASGLLGRETFLSGLSRSAFHWSSIRESENVQVFFDSSRLFREKRS